MQMIFIRGWRLEVPSRPRLAICVHEGSGAFPHSSMPRMRAGPRRWARRMARWLVADVLRCGPIPRHVAFIMDGNRRWAEQRQLKRRDGHAFGFAQLKECLKWCLDLGIECAE